MTRRTSSAAARADDRPGPGPAPPPVRLRDFSRSLPMSLLRTREAVMRLFRASLRQHGLTEQQWRVLRALSTVEAFEVTALAEATFLLPPSLSRIARDLEARGLIERRGVATDLRRAAISISALGLRTIELVSPESEGIYRRITEAFGADRLERLQAQLGEFERCVAGLEPPA